MCNQISNVHMSYRLCSLGTCVHSPLPPCPVPGMDTWGGESSGLSILALPSGATGRLFDKADFKTPVVSSSRMRNRSDCHGSAIPRLPCSVTGLPTPGPEARALSTGRCKGSLSHTCGGLTAQGQ